jgi:hypothetical protein
MAKQSDLPIRTGLLAYINPNKLGPSTDLVSRLLTLISGARLILDLINESSSHAWLGNQTFQSGQGLSPINPNRLGIVFRQPFVA